jgi:flagellar hook-associated protein 2
VTSAHEGVSASITADATAGSFAMTVDQIAAAHRLRFTDSAAMDSVIVSGGTALSLTRDGVTTTLDSGDGTLAGVVQALNATGTGVSATTIRLDDGTHKLVVQSIETGEASQFTLTSGDGTALLSGASATAGQDAQVTVEGNTVRSATNTFTDVVPGITFTVSASAVGEASDLTVKSDPTSAVGSIKALVEQVNSMIGSISSASSWNATSKKSGPLSGESSVRTVGVSLQQALYPSDNTSMAQFGLQTDRNGKLVFDEAKFTEALAADPAAVATAFTGTTGFASRIEAVAVAASDKDNGTITAAIKGRDSAISRLEANIDAWDTRLELREASLTRQYTALEVALSSMNSQSTWLAGQISSLNGSSS